MTVTFQAETTEEFAGRLGQAFNNASMVALVDLGHRTNLFATAAALSQFSARELADAAGLAERPVREWLGGLVCAGVFDLADPTPGAERFALSAERAVMLTGDGPMNFARMAGVLPTLGSVIPDIADAFASGDGVAPRRYGAAMAAQTDAITAPTFEHVLGPVIIPMVEGLAERLASGARVADIGCGVGRAVRTLAATYPSSTFVGLDLGASEIETATALANEQGLGNARFVQHDASRIEELGPFDIVTAFDVVHDLGAQAEVLSALRRSLAPGGVLVVLEPNAANSLDENRSHPFGVFGYAMSTLYCLQVSLATGGTGVGTMWGEGAIRAALHDVGFEVEPTHAIPGDLFNALFVGRVPA